MKQYWNEGVLNTFDFLGKVPNMISYWSRRGLELASDKLEVKQLVGDKLDEK